MDHRLQNADGEDAALEGVGRGLLRDEVADDAAPNGGTPKK